MKKVLENECRKIALLGKKTEMFFFIEEKLCSYNNLESTDEDLMNLNLFELWQDIGDYYIYIYIFLCFLILERHDTSFQSLCKLFSFF